MMRRPKPTFLVFGALGGLLLLNLVLPIVNLFIQADWAGWMTSLREQGAKEALEVSALSSAIAVVIMTLLGVPLGYLLARGRLPFTQLWIGLVFLPMVVPDLAGGILLLQTFGPYGTIGHPAGAWGLELTNNLAGIVVAQLLANLAPSRVARHRGRHHARLDPCARRVRGDTGRRLQPTYPAGLYVG